jgi:hypothetical protein
MVNLNPPLTAVKNRHLDSDLCGLPLDDGFRVSSGFGACGLAKFSNNLIVTRFELGSDLMNDGHAALLSTRETST